MTHKELFIAACNAIGATIKEDDNYNYYAFTIETAPTVENFEPCRFRRDRTVPGYGVLDDVYKDFLSGDIFVVATKQEDVPEKYRAAMKSRDEVVALIQNSASKLAS